MEIPSSVRELRRAGRRLSRFAATSVVATTVDYFLYLFLVVSLAPVVAQILSSGTGMTINYILQRKFVFSGGARTVRTSFALSLMFSLVGMGLGALLVYGLTRFEFFRDFPAITKAIVIATVFVYNYNTKKIAFGV